MVFRILMLRRLVIVCGLCGLWACDVDRLPKVHEPDPKGTTRIALRNCTVQLPPVVDRDGKAEANIGKYVDESDLCKAVTALKKWIDSVPIEPLQPGDWARVQSIDVWRMPLLGFRSIEGNQYQLDLYADIPERPRLVGVTMSKPTGEMKFFEVHR